MRANRLKFNPDKILLLGGNPDWLGDFLPGLDGVTLHLKDHVHNLGVVLDLAILIDNQISAVAMPANCTSLPLS